MTARDDVTELAEKIHLVRQEGDQCRGILFNKSIVQWLDIFNRAAEKIDMPVVYVGSLKSGEPEDIAAHLTDLTDAFGQAANGPVIILADNASYGKIGNMHFAMAMDDALEELGAEFPQAIFTQIVSDALYAEPINFFCLNPKQPRTGLGPML